MELTITDLENFQKVYYRLEDLSEEILKWAKENTGLIEFRSPEVDYWFLEDNSLHIYYYDTGNDLPHCRKLKGIPFENIVCGTWNNYLKDEDQKESNKGRH